MDRVNVKKSFTLERTPEWGCPVCGKGLLSLKKESFSKDERAHSRDHSDDAWEPDWVEYVFSCLFYCSNSKCREVIGCVGVGFVDWDVEYDEEGMQEQVWYDAFRPKYFEPPLNIISIPDKCPESVRNPLIESFRHFFSSPSLSANSVRVALECLLDELKVVRFKLVGNKRRVISLHERISKIPAKHQDLKDLILAVKWLGNAGSHASGGVTVDDVLDAYEMTEHVLSEIYVSPRKRLNALAKRVNMKKGPAK